MEESWPHGPSLWMRHAVRTVTIFSDLRSYHRVLFYRVEILQLVTYPDPQPSIIDHHHFPSRVLAKIPATHSLQKSLSLFVAEAFLDIMLHIQSHSLAG